MARMLCRRRPTWRMMVFRRRAKQKDRKTCCFLQPCYPPHPRHRDQGLRWRPEAGPPLHRRRLPLAPRLLRRPYRVHDVTVMAAGPLNDWPGVAVRPPQRDRIAPVGIRDDTARADRKRSAGDRETWMQAPAPHRPWPPTLEGQNPRIGMGKPSSQPQSTAPEDVPPPRSRGKALDPPNRS